MYGNRDMIYLLRTYSLLTVACATTHVSTVSQLVFRLWAEGLATEFVFRGEVLQLILLSIVITVWCFFTIWDLHRTHIIQTPFPSDIVYYCAAVLIFGPTATMTSIWKRREIALESSRQRR